MSLREKNRKWRTTRAIYGESLLVNGRILSPDTKITWWAATPILFVKPRPSKMASSRDDWKKKKELEEARKAGTAPAEVDEEGRYV